MLFYLTLILGCQLAGEALVVALGLPLPGPVAGMALLFTGLVLRGLPKALAETADTLLAHLALLFVPAGVGVMLHFDLLAADWPAIAVALVVSTAATVVVTGLIMRWLGGDLGGRD
ncbi:MAG: CidA/LrgA family protein [Pseudomonadota bacterium]